MTTSDFYTTAAYTTLRARARAEHDPYASKPWVVLAYKRTSDLWYKVAIVAGFNRYTGEVISWNVPSIDGDQYDISEAIEVFS